MSWTSEHNKERERFERERDLLEYREKNYDAIEAGVMPATPPLKNSSVAPISSEQAERIRKIVREMREKLAPWKGK